MLSFFSTRKRQGTLILISAILLSTSGCKNSYYEGEHSDHYDGQVFYDPYSPTETPPGFWATLKLLWQSHTSKPWPQHVPVKAYDRPPQRVYGSTLRVSYVGHVTFLIQTQGLNILTDPVWSERASPISFLGPRRVVAPGIRFEDLPDIDVVWVSHNHYDHLDLPTLKRLWQKCRPRIITPLGNDTLIRKAIPGIQAEAYDWGDEITLSPDVRFYLSAMQHWSRRGLFDKNQALWAALTIATRSGNIYFIGDSGYGTGYHYQEIIKKFQKYRLALIPMGAYEPRWFMKNAHMNPEEFVRAHLDLHKPLSIPSHYDVFKLTYEGYGEASIALRQAIERYHLDPSSIIELDVGGYLYVEE